MSIKKISIIEVILWILAVLLIIVVASPFLLGFKIQEDYAAIADSMSEMTQTRIQIESYERGFFSSHAVINVAIPDTLVKLQFREKIIHGPLYLGLINQGKSPLVAAVVTGELIPPAEFSSQINKLFAGKSPLVYQNVMDFVGNLTSEGYIPAINSELPAPKGDGVVKIKSSGITLTSSYSTAPGKLSGDVSIPAISTRTNVDAMDIQGLTLTYSGMNGVNKLLIGDSVLSLKSFNYTSNSDQVSLHSVSLRTMTNEQGRFINSQLQLNAQEILASNARLGPVVFNFGIKGLDSQKLLELQNIQKQIEQQIQQGIPQEQVSAMYAGQMLALLPDLLKQSEITIKPLKINSDLGALSSELVFLLDGLDANAPADPLFIVNAINLQMSLQIDEGLLRQFIKWQLMSHDSLSAGDTATRRIEESIPTDQKISENIQGLLDEGWLTSNDRVYHSNLSFQQGQMILNGKAVDPVGYFMNQMQQTAP